MYRLLNEIKCIYNSMDYVFTNSETIVIFIYRCLTNFKNFSAKNSFK